MTTEDDEGSLQHPDDGDEGDGADRGKKRKERLEQNRISARESRKRKKTMIEELQRTVITLSRENKELNERNDQLRRQLVDIGAKVRSSCHRFGNRVIIIFFHRIEFWFPIALFLLKIVPQRGSFASYCGTGYSNSRGNNYRSGRRQYQHSQPCSCGQRRGVVGKCQKDGRIKVWQLRENLLYFSMEDTSLVLVQMLLVWR